MIFPVLCEGAKLRIRRFAPGDAEAIYAYSREPSTFRDLPDEVFDSLEEARDALAAFEENADQERWPMVFCVARRSDDYPVGHVSLSPIGQSKIEIGYAIGEEHQNRGYGGEAVKIFTAWTLRSLPITRLHGIVKESNPASIRCLENAGYKLIDRREQDCFGGHYAVREYEITQEEEAVP